MKQPQLMINDYVIYNQRVVRVIGMLVTERKGGSEINVSYDVTWVERDSEGMCRQIDSVEASKLHAIDATQKILLKIGFKCVGYDTYNYNDVETRKVVVINRVDNSMYVCKHGNYRLLDFGYADFVSDVQHAFGASGIDFPYLDLYFAEHASDYKREKYLK